MLVELRSSSASEGRRCWLASEGRQCWLASEGRHCCGGPYKMWGVDCNYRMPTQDANPIAGTLNKIPQLSQKSFPEYITCEQKIPKFQSVYGAGRIGRFFYWTSAIGAPKTSCHTTAGTSKVHFTPSKVQSAFYTPSRGLY